MLPAGTNAALDLLADKRHCSKSAAARGAVLSELAAAGLSLGNVAPTANPRETTAEILARANRVLAAAGKP
jgi:hypothetical protein